MSQQAINETADEIDRYVNTWVRVLTTMRGRSPEEVRRWAEPFVCDHHELTLHESAAHWVAPSLAPAEFTATLDPETLGRLHGDLEFALDQGDAFWDPQSDEEIRQAHQRVLAVLDAHRTRVPADVVCDLIQTRLPRPEAFELALRVATRYWRAAIVSDPIRGREFGRDAKVPFGKVSRLLIRNPHGALHLWWDAFGLNVVAVTAQREHGGALLDAVRHSLALNNFRGDAPLKLPKAAA